MAKPRKARGWTEKTLQRASRALAVNKKRLDAASGSGLASDTTLGSRGYDPDPSGGGPKMPRQVAPPAGKRPRKRALTSSAAPV
jgi:hypothetical protein